MLLRVRYLLRERKGNELFAEEVVTAGFRRGTDALDWLPANGDEVLQILKTAQPIGNISQQERVTQAEWALKMLSEHAGDLQEIADVRARELEESHSRLREYTGGGRIRARAYQPDALAAYVFLPGGAG